jgi:ABC-type multidrug transport system fused ATPase/permease subunit
VKADISVVAVPSFGVGITSFTTILVSDTEVDISWTTDVNITNVMVRAKYGSMPIDRTDGYLVYQGVDFSAIDTSMNLDETAGTIYYRIWAQNSGGAWLDYEVNTGSLEGLNVGLIAAYLLLTLFMMVAILLTIMYETKKKEFLGMLSAIFWIVEGGYCYYLRGSSYVTPPLNSLFEVLGLVGVLIGIVLGISVVIDTQNDRTEKKRKSDAENAPKSYDEHLREVRQKRMELHTEQQLAMAQAAEERAIRREDAAARRYKEGND